MALTKGQKAVIERAWDEVAGCAICEFSRFWYNETVPAAAPHHLEGRGKSDSPRQIIALSYELHVALHRSLPDARGNPVTKEKCITVLRNLYDNWEGLDEAIGLSREEEPG